MIPLPVHRLLRFASILYIVLHFAKQPSEAFAPYRSYCRHPQRTDGNIVDSVVLLSSFQCQQTANNINPLHHRIYSSYFTHTSIHATNSNQEKDKDAQDTSSLITKRQSSSSAIPMPVSVLGATTSAVVAGTFYLVLCWRRDVFMVSFFVGAIANGVLSKVLKRLINQQRPEGVSNDDTDDAETQLASKTKNVIKPSDGGMPSSHAMSLGFIGTVTVSQLLSIANQVEISSIGIISSCSTCSSVLLLIPVLLLYVAVSLWYRVRVQLHTPAQIGVGLTIGTMHGFLFQGILQNYLQSWLIVQLPFLWQPDDGLLRSPYLIVPAIVGALVVGSIERRISYWFKTRRQSQDKVD
jgi:hypothetical protein